MTDTCTITLLNQVDVSIRGLRSADIARLVNTYSDYVPGYRFMPQFVLGRWDGKMYYFSDTGKTYVGLLPEILTYLKERGYWLELVDRRAPVPYGEITPVEADIFAAYAHPSTGQPTMLRDYQVASINAGLSSGRGIIRASTGAGKTLTCAALCVAVERAGGKSVTIVPGKDLVTQTAAVYTSVGLDTGIVGGGKKEFDHQHVVATWQTLHRMATMMTQFDLIIVDEVHTASGKILSDLLLRGAKNTALRIGVTGTMPKDRVNELALRSALGDIIYEVPASVLIEAGTLAKPTIRMVRMEEDMRSAYSVHKTSTSKPLTYRQFKDQAFPDFTAESTSLRKDPERLDWIAEYLTGLQSGDQANVLCIVNNISTGDALQDRLENSVFVNGQAMKSTKLRKQVYDRFATEDNLIVIATAQIASTGLDIPRIFNVVLVDIGKSFVRVIQTVGRGLRKASDKDDVLISDLHSDLKYSRQHAIQRLSYYKEAGYDVERYSIDHRTQALEVTRPNVDF